MSLITVLPKILEAGKREYEEMKAGIFRMEEETGVHENEGKNLLIHGDNGTCMKYLLQEKELGGKIRMVYIDPPFFTKSNHEAVIHAHTPDEKSKKLSAKHLAYEDHWSYGIGQYLTMLTSRLYLIRDLLTDDGTIWVHLDWHAVHYVRILMDEIFGADHFVNEIVWTYKSGGASKKHFARKHDTILVYSKNRKYYFQPLKEKSYNRGFKPYHFKGVEEFQDEMGWYTMVNMKDVWHIDMVGRTSAERTGYATQKPVALLERILECSTQEGDLCADFFCGSGTLADAAQRMNRRWICCDQGALAVSTTQRRISQREETWNGYQLLTADNVPEYGTASAVRSENGITLKDCRVQLDESMLEGKDVEALKYVAETCPLQLIEYWSVDCSYDGSVHRPQCFYIRKKGELTLEAELPEGSRGKRCSVVVADILGNRYQAVLEP